MFQFRTFVKDCLNLSGRAKSNVICLSFDIKRDLLEKAVSTFNVEYIDNNIDIGDILGLYDEYGTVYYIGVVDEIDTTVNQITCTSNISYFNYQWLYDDMREQIGTTELLLGNQITNTFKNSNDSLMALKYGDIDIEVKSNILNNQFPLKQDNEVINFEDFLFDCYKNYGIVCNLDVKFQESRPRLTIDASVGNNTPIKVGNNFNAIQNFTINTDVAENNKLMIYSEDGTTLRATYYGTTNGITQDDESPLRIKRINNVIVFSDDDIENVVTENLDTVMYNHCIKFDLMLNNNFYDFFELFKLGCPIDVWYNGIYFNSIFTGYEFIKEENIDVTRVSVTCGMVRNSLTSKLLKYVR